ncbi:hypothetical protein BDN67DRAFT_1014515 [Paxillus ammoniavirescens]|nr:hypothetical protein BDN67DRAFT_1014515 [Paxillus ammoniavirescens]
MTNPREEECLNHMLPEFEEACLLFTLEGKTDEKVAALLSNLWDFNDNKAKLVWDRKQAAEAEAWQEERKHLGQEAERQCLLCEQEEEQAKQEEWKNPLYFFTNTGIHEAVDDGSGDEDLLTLIQMDKGPMFQMAASAKAKKHKVRDEHLTWEEFSQANYHMIVVMKQQEWPDE